MKVIAVIEVPESYKGKWYIDGMIRYTEDESLMKIFDKDLVELKPLPRKRDIDKILEFCGYDNIIQESLARGYNSCLDEITGETNG